MNCDRCGDSQLWPARFTFERVTPDGKVLRMEVDGFECPACSEEVLLGRDAERISEEWRRIPGVKHPA
ncbi:MAG: hypothetical protein ACR2HN_12520 [Tepidiformaceae bacterium]